MRAGRPLNPRRQAWALRFPELRKHSANHLRRRLLTERMMDHLDRCRDDEARRVLLGIRT
jgi:hypothetical protein